MLYNWVLKSDHSKSWNIQNPDFLTIKFQMDRFSKGLAMVMVLAILKLDHAKPFLSGFEMVYDKMAAICPNFKWLALWIPDPIQNPDHFQTNHYLTIWSPNLLFQIHTALKKLKICCLGSFCFAKHTYSHFQPFCGLHNTTLLYCWKWESLYTIEHQSIVQCVKILPNFIL